MLHLVTIPVIVFVLLMLKCVVHRFILPFWLFVLQVLDTDMPEGEGVMVGLGTADLDEEDAMCYTELKASTTLLVPVELAEEQQTHLLDGGTLETLSSAPDGTQPEDSDSFTLMLDPDVEELPDASELDHNAVLLPLHEPEEPQDVDNQLTANSEVFILDHTVQVPDNKLEEVKDLVSDIEPVVTGVTKIEAQPGEVLQTVEQVITPQAETSQETKGLSNGESPELGPADVQEELHTPLHGEVLESSVPENVLLSEEHLGKVNEVSALDTEVSNIAKDNITEPIQIDTTPLLAGELDELSTTKQLARPKSPGRPKSPARTKVERSGKDTEDILENAKAVLRSPSRRTRKTVTFPVPNLDVEKDLTEEEQMDSQVPSTPRRVTRSGKQLQDCQVPVTPRRSTRKADAEQRANENNQDMPPEKASKPASPARKTPQKATPRKGSRRTRSTVVDDDEALSTDPIPSDDSATQARQSTRKLQAPIEVPEIHQEVPEEMIEPAKAQSSPSRFTRKSTRGLAIERFQQDPAEDATTKNQPFKTPPRSRRKTVASTAEKANSATFVIDDAQLQSVSRRLTRSRHWNQGEDLGKEMPDLIPLEVETQTLQADALVERLKNEEASEESVPVVTEIIHAKRKNTRSAALNETQNADIEESKLVVSDEMQEHASKSLESARRTRVSKVSEQNSMTVGDSVTPIADLKRTRGRQYCNASFCSKLQHFNVPSIKFI